MEIKNTYKLGGIIVLLILILFLLLHSRRFELQYVQDGELVTETFYSPSGFNARASELKEQNIKYWLYQE